MIKPKRRNSITQHNVRKTEKCSSWAIFVHSNLEIENEKPSDKTRAKCRREGIGSSANRKCIVQNN
jgi:hypothetical protein